MPDLNRRGFLQIAGAASVVPLLPALPARVAANSLSPAKALWAGIYAKSGSAAKFAGVAQGMGLPPAAISGVSARAVGVRAVVGAINAPTLAANTAGTPPHALWRRLERIIAPEQEEQAVEAGQDADASPSALLAEAPEHDR